MSCSNPNYALDLGVCDGKRKLKFLPKRADLSSIHQLEARYGKERILILPCGKCTSCQMTYARQWAIRCSLEASLYQENWFVTLTYDNQHFPKPGQFKKDYQKFLKRLRKKLGSGIRYFGCFEYGEHTYRPHFHLILFNCHFPDLKVVGKRKNGYLWKSQILLDTWSNGLVDIGEVTFNSCSYVARYVIKKKANPMLDEFIFMSNRPGLGVGWFEKHKDILKEYDTIYFNFGRFNKASLPRYFDKLIERSDPKAFEALKEKRISSANIGQVSELLQRSLTYKEELYSVHDDLLNRKVKRLKRSL